MASPGSSGRQRTNTIRCGVIVTGGSDGAGSENMIPLRSIRVLGPGTWRRLMFSQSRAETMSIPRKPTVGETYPWPVRIRELELRRVRLPLVEPFRAAHGVEHARDILLVRVATDDGEGWGECTALTEPTYSPEYVDGAQDVIVRHLAPRLLDGLDLAPVRGHPMAKAALETAVLDAELRAQGRSLATHLGAVRDRVPAGV